MTGRFTQLQDGLYITSVQPEDTGSYVCEAKNVAGSVESEGTLSIQGMWYTTTGWVIYLLSPAGGYRQLCVWGQKCGWVESESTLSIQSKWYTTTGWLQAAMCVRPKMWLGQWRVRAHCLYKVSGTQLQDGLYIYSVRLPAGGYRQLYVWGQKCGWVSGEWGHTVYTR